MLSGTFAAFSKIHLNTSKSTFMKVVHLVEGHNFHVDWHFKLWVEIGEKLDRLTVPGGRGNWEDVENGVWGPPPTERVHLVGVLISLEKNFYRLPFTPPLSGRLIGPSNFCNDIQVKDSLSLGVREWRACMESWDAICVKTADTYWSFCELSCMFHGCV
jgi:hypothetical protein